MSRMLLVICTMALWPISGSAAQASGTAALHLVIDCSGCTPEEKEAEALAILEADLPLPTSKTVLDIDVTDFGNAEIARFRVELAAHREDVGGAVPVPPATVRKFRRASTLIDAMSFIPPGADFRQVDPLPVDYGSALDLVGDNGSQELKLSEAINDAYVPGGQFGSLTFAQVLEAVLPLAADFIDDDAKLVVQASDGTLAIVEGRVLIGRSGQEEAVWWQIVDDGLRLADGTAIEDTAAAPATSTVK